VRYVQALILDKQRADVNAHLTALPADRKTQLHNGARDQIDAMLSRGDMSRARFNALSSAIEKDTLLRQRAQQIVVEEQIGTWMSGREPIIP
jgi:hypothetical protein